MHILILNFCEDIKKPTFTDKILTVPKAGKKRKDLKIDAQANHFCH